jgi:tight adherence protein C
VEVLVAVLATCGILLGGRGIAVRQHPALRASLISVSALAGSVVPGRMSRPPRGILVRIGAGRLARRLGRETRLRDLWELAGRPGPFEAILGWRLLISSGGLTMSLAAAPAFRPSLFLAPLVTLAGLRMPEITLVRLVRRRREAIASHVPDLVELLVSTTEAGLNPLIAFQRSAEILTGPLGDELRVAAHQMELGLPWLHALDQLTERTNVPALRRLVAALARSNRLGTAVGATLRSVATDLRGERRARAEELARRAPIKMLFPLVFVILPAFLLLTVGPVVLATIRSLH